MTKHVCELWQQNWCSLTELLRQQQIRERNRQYAHRFPRRAREPSTDPFFPKLSIFSLSRLRFPGRPSLRKDKARWQSRKGGSEDAVGRASGVLRDWYRKLLKIDFRVAERMMAVPSDPRGPFLPTQCRLPRLRLNSSPSWMEISLKMKGEYCLSWEM